MTHYTDTYIVNWRLAQGSTIAHAWTDGIHFRLMEHARYSIAPSERASFLAFCELLQDAVTELDWDALVGASMDSGLL